VSEREVPSLTKIDPAFASVHCWHVGFSAANTGDFTHTHVVSDQLEDLVVQDKKQNSEYRTTDRKGFDTLVIFTCWMLWKQQNSRVFGNARQRCSAAVLAGRIKVKLNLWNIAGVGVCNFLARDNS
jgi:hypothetical protein